ncbi:MAG TPA: RNA polymerase factor sigma-54 [bacterium]|nr:RNA polymerase factor sigma-54 [bacterium]
MAIELRQSLKLAQQLVMTPQLQQAIKLLQLSRLELAEAINQEMLENPVLEELQEADLEPEPLARHTDEGEGEKPKNAEDSYDDLDWEKFLDEFGEVEFSGFRATARSEDEEFPSVEATLSQPVTLADHLRWQLKLGNFSLEEEAISDLIIGNLNDDGYLTADLELITQESGESAERVLEVLKKVQNLDPVGIGARDLKECLLLQVRQFSDVDPLVIDVINDHLGRLENKDYRGISRALKVPVTRVRDAVMFIQGLEPKPGRPFSQDRAEYITPDIYVYKVASEFIIVLNEDGLPKLRVSPYYRRILKEKGKDFEVTKDYIQDKLRSAVWLIRSLHQRQRTIYRVMESILARQRDFFEKGIGHLKPMVLRDVAQDIQMHESTVSRVTTNKYVYTTQGIFPMKFFFNSKIGTVEGGSVAAESVKDRIKQLIAKEDQRKPLSDQEIVEKLREYGIEIARRTVTKYREMMGILSSSKRKRLA